MSQLQPPASTPAHHCSEVPSMSEKVLVQMTEGEQHNSDKKKPRRTHVFIVHLFSSGTPVFSSGTSSICFLLKLFGYSKLLYLILQYSSKSEHFALLCCLFTSIFIQYFNLEIKAKLKFLKRQIFPNKGRKRITRIRVRTRTYGTIIVESLQ